MAQRGPVQAVKVYAIVQARWPRVSSYGIYSCRHIAGSSTWSQHSWGNAVDIHPPGATSADSPTKMEYGDKVYAWLKHRQKQFNIENILWRVPDHFNHIHIDFSPSYTGTPPCAHGDAPKIPGIHDVAGSSHPHRATGHKSSSGGSKHTGAGRGKPPMGGTGRSTRGVGVASTDTTSTSKDCKPPGFLEGLLQAGVPLATYKLCQSESDIGDAIGSMFATVGRWLEAGAGGFLMMGGAAIVAFAASGQEVPIPGTSGQVALGKKLSEKNYIAGPGMGPVQPKVDEKLELQKRRIGLAERREAREDADRKEIEEGMKMLDSQERARAKAGLPAGGRQGKVDLGERNIPGIGKGRKTG